MKEKILITGLNGQLAQKLINFLDLNKYQLNYLTTRKNKCSQNVFYWDIQKNYIDPKALHGTKHIIHLAGFNISNRWTKNNKKIMFESRVKSSQLIFDHCKMQDIKLQTFISASAMGFYGFNQQGIKKETSKAGNDWMADLCVNWEEVADKFKTINARVCKLRFAVIIDEKSEIMQKINLSFKVGLGLILGTGKQQFPWIHINDVCRFIQHILQIKEIKGVFNIASPEKKSYYEFIKRIQTVRYPKSILISIPQIIFNLVIPQKKDLIFNNISLCVDKMKNTGFNWQYENLEKFLKQE